MSSVSLCHRNLQSTGPTRSPIVGGNGTKTQSEFPILGAARSVEGEPLRRDVHNKPVLTFVSLLGAIAVGCASNEADRATRITQAISGLWKSEAVEADPSGWRGALAVLDGSSHPQPEELVIRNDGSFEAHYDARAHRVIQRILGNELENPIAGRFEIRLDWTGTPWISFSPGAPERRVSLQQGKLTLHAVAPQWSNEAFRRASERGGNPETPGTR